MKDQQVSQSEKYIRTGFAAIRQKFHLDEVASTVTEVIAKFHHHVAHFVEGAGKKIPLINLLLDAIGNIAAIATIRRKKTAIEKRNLGIKVTAGLITAAVTITAFAIPHIAVPLIIAGSIINVSYNAFSIRKKQRQVKELIQQHQTANSKTVTPLQIELTQHTHQLIHKSVKTLTSTVALVCSIIMLANPLTIIPMSIVCAITAVTYTLYHYRQPIMDAAMRVSERFKKAFVSSTAETNTSVESAQTTNQQQQQSAVSQTQTATFLQQQQNLLAKESQAHSHSFAEQHNEIQQTATASFLDHQEAALEKFNDLPHPQPESVKNAKETEEEEDDDGGSGSSVAEPQLRL